MPPLRALADAGSTTGACASTRCSASATRTTRRRRALLGGGVEIATDDGSVGHHGLVTALLGAELDADDHAVVYACGPPGMLEAVRALCAARDVPAQLALEAGMACGFGACYGCVVPVRAGGYVRLCIDGPVLDGDVLDHVPVH